MSVLRLRLVASVVFFFTVNEFTAYLNTANGKPVNEVASTATAAVAKPFPIEKPLLGFAVGTLTSMLLQKLLYLDKKDNPECALSINNKLSYSLINPYLYIEHGGNPMPVPLKVKSNSSEETTLQAVATTGDTSGLLFYEIEYVGLYLMIFWKIQGDKLSKSYMPNRFSVDIVPEFQDNEIWLSQKYNQAKTSSDKMTGPNEHFEKVKEILKSPTRPTVPQFKITIQAQMTMGKKAEFMVELKDDLPSFSAPQFYKRDFGTSLALAAIPLGLNLAFKKITSYIPSEQSCTISLENLSKQESLVRPSWFITAGETSSIVPWEIKTEEVGEITFLIPLGGTKISETFKHTVYFLSYHIEGTEYDIVIGTWFPLKLETKPGSMGTSRETPRYTVFIVKPLGTTPMKNVLQTIGNLMLQYSGNPDQLNTNLAKENKEIFNSIGQTNLVSSRIQVLQVTKFQTYREWRYPLFTKAVANMPQREYQIKIVTAMGIGQATGMVVKVEVVPGKAPMSFMQQNPQMYKEPKETKDAETQYPTIN